MTKYQNCIQNEIPMNPKYFKEEAICELLTIPHEKPDMERILDIVVWAEIENIRLVETEVGNSIEGQKLSGNKLVVEVSLKEKVTYVADEPTQTVHAAHYEMLKSVFIIVPKTIGEKSLCNLIKSDRIIVTPYVEDVSFRMIDCRTIHKCVMLFLNASIC